MGGCTSSRRGHGGPLDELTRDEGEAWVAGNLLLQRWQHTEVLALQRIYRHHRGDSGDLAASSLADVFWKLRDRGWEELAKRSLVLFDSRRAQAVDFRDLCRGLALCCKGTQLEKLRFLFDLFSSSEDVYYGLASLRPEAASDAALAALRAIKAGADLSSLLEAAEAPAGGGSPSAKDVLALPRLRFLVASLSAPEASALARYIEACASLHAKRADPPAVRADPPSVRADPPSVRVDPSLLSLLRGPAGPAEGKEAAPPPREAGGGAGAAAAPRAAAPPSSGRTSPRRRWTRCRRACSTSASSPSGCCPRRRTSAARC